jgi:hypothetical protein
MKIGFENIGMLFFKIVGVIQVQIIRPSPSSNVLVFQPVTVSFPSFPPNVDCYLAHPPRYPRLM